MGLGVETCADFECEQITVPAFLLQDEADMGGGKKYLIYIQSDQWDGSTSY